MTAAGHGRTAASESPARFHAGVVAFVYEPLRDVFLVVQRSARKNYAPDQWWVVTGTVEHGEGFADALRREVHEELATTVRDCLLLDTTHYYLGKELPGNEWLSASFLCTLENPSAIRLNDEHVDYRWVTDGEFVKEISQSSYPVDWMIRGLRLAQERKATLRKS